MCKLEKLREFDWNDNFSLLKRLCNALTRNLRQKFLTLTERIILKKHIAEYGLLSGFLYYKLTVFY